MQLQPDTCTWFTDNQLSADWKSFSLTLNLMVFPNLFLLDNRGILLLQSC